jgi:hypothetical protein
VELLTTLLCYFSLHAIMLCQQTDLKESDKFDSMNNILHLIAYNHTLNLTNVKGRQFFRIRGDKPYLHIYNHHDGPATLVK